MSLLFHKFIHLYIHCINTMTFLFLLPCIVFVAQIDLLYETVQECLDTKAPLTTRCH